MNRFKPLRGGGARFALLVLLPILTAAVVFAAASLLHRLQPEPEPGVDQEFLREAIRTTEFALERSTREAAERASSGRIGNRLIGLGVFFNNGEFYEWEGTPMAVPPDRRTPESSTWFTLQSGFRVRLVVVTGSDSSGRRASATLDLPPAGSAPHARPAVSPAGLARASAAVTFVLLLVMLFPWNSITQAASGTGLVLLAVLAGRWALLAARVPSRLFPAELGTAAVYGSGEAWGLLASPVDLLLTGIAARLAVRAVLDRSHRLVVSPGAGRWTGRILAGIMIVLGALAVRGVAESIAWNSDILLLSSRGILSSAARVALITGLALFVLLASDGLAALPGLGPRPRRNAGAGAQGGAAAWRRLASVALFALLAASFLHRGQEQVGAERLKTEYAREVLEQTSRRVVALQAALHRAGRSPDAFQAVSTPDRQEPAGPAGRIWIRSELLEAGYRSSITIHDPAGVPVSHFGFGLPLLEENPAETDTPDFEPGVLSERYEPLGEVGSVRQELLHAQEPLLKGADRRGWVVAHVLDEPENLPFLPANRAYLAALAPDRIPDRSATASPDPDYVLYDSAGIVQFSTLVQPPAWRVEYDKAAIEGSTVPVDTPGGRYHALPLVESDRLHLLLLPARTWLDRTGAVIRLALAAVLLLAILRGLPILGSRSGVARLVGLVRSSFHRKLMATLLLVSIIPLVLLSLFLQRTFEARMEAALLDTASRYGATAQRVVEDYATAQPGGAEGERPVFDDNLLFWLKRVVGQDIHLFEDGLLTASSQREVFQTGLMVPRLPGSIYRQLLQENKPARVLPTRIGPGRIPVAYAPVRLVDPTRKIVVAVPLLFPQTEIRREVDRVMELLILTTVALAGLLGITAEITSRRVARPLREMAAATRRISDGSYDTRLASRTRDELSDLVAGFNSMATSLESQRRNLIRRKDYIEALLSHATAGVVSVDPEGRIVTMNPAARRLLGLRGGQPADGTALVSFISGIPRLSPLARALARSAPGTEPEEIDVEPEEGMSGSLRLRLVRVPLPGISGGAPGTLILMDDVTDMMRSSQLEAWAEMARAIAHEIKNPLTPIQLSSEHLERILRDRGALPSKELESCLDTIKKQVRTLREIAAGFSAYAKLPSLQPETVDPVEFMRRSVAPYRSGLPDGIRLVEEYRPCPEISIDPKVLSRAVVNLVENALQSMDAPGGTLSVEARPEPGGGVRLTVGDTGTGLGSEVRKRLFEPYFSTKSSGTGLGLAIVKQSVEAHGGRVEVDSRPGEGSRFHIVLPRSADGV